ncbi:MAG: SGNH/GDSL hydrolase family protein [Taibaiella sp.]|nr:SGNH/GDSL hydrolase family protein [Taibaiella sp.]
MLKYLSAILIFFVITERLGAQTTEAFTWRDLAHSPFPVIEGQAWPKETKSPYDCLPARAEQTVRKEVWDLSHHDAGLYIKFKSNADEIRIRYCVSSGNNFAMPYVSVTGVSGVDLYAIDHSGKWVWVPAEYRFFDTISYDFSNLEVDSQIKGTDCEFKLFLPLYKTISWMEIGIPEGKTFIPMPLSEEKSIVIFGSSMVQGGYASRPDMDWTNILERQLDYPLINLGFSGNGRLEKPVIDMMRKIYAKIYVLDCLPNLVNIPEAELENKIRESVKALQAKHPSTPVLLVDHCLGAGSGIINAKRVEDCERATKVLQQTFTKLKQEGAKNIYLLSNTALNMDINSTIDSSHPTNPSMLQHADVYAKTIRSILHDPAYSTTQPVTQTRDSYDWRARHNEFIELNKKMLPQNIIIANSIIHYRGGEPKHPTARGVDSWKRYLALLGLRNMGFGWDRAENTLWRVYHGELDGYIAKHMVVMISTNNLTIKSNDEIIAELKLLLEAIQFRQTGTDVLLSGIFPRRGMKISVQEINVAISRLPTAMKVTYIDPGRVLLISTGKIDECLFNCGLHRNVAGYNKLAPVLAAYLEK